MSKAEFIALTQARATARRRRVVERVVQYIAERPERAFMALFFLQGVSFALGAILVLWRHL